MNWKMYRNEEVEFVNETVKYCVFRDCDIDYKMEQRLSTVF